MGMSLAQGLNLLEPPFLGCHTTPIGTTLRLPGEPLAGRQLAIRRKFGGAKTLAPILCVVRGTGLKTGGLSILANPGD